MLFCGLSVTSAAIDPTGGSGGGPTFDYYVDSATGDDGNDGQTPGTAWATLGALRAQISALPTSGTLSALVSGTFLDDHLRLGAGIDPGVYATIYVESGTVFNATSGVDQSFTDSTGEAWTLDVIGLGTGESRPKIQGFDTGTGNGGGVNSSLGTRLIYRNLIVDNCVDGFSLHGALSHGEVYDCTFRNCSKSAFAHVHANGSFTAKRCVFEGRTGASLGIGSETTAASINSLYEDCTFTPIAANQAAKFVAATLRRCVIGTLALNVNTFGSNRLWGDTAISATPTTLEDCFVNANWDTNSPVNMTECYGPPTMRQAANAVGSTFTNCVFVGGAPAPAIFLLFRNFDPGSAAQVIFRNTVIKGFSGSAAVGGGYSATDAGYFSASDSRVDFCCLQGNTLSLDADLTALGTPYIANNITSDPLLGSRSTTNKNDWAVQAGSPCIGAGLGGADIGFTVS